MSAVILIFYTVPLYFYRYRCFKTKKEDSPSQIQYWGSYHRQGITVREMVGTLGSLSNDDDDTKDDAQKKLNLYFTSEIRDCLDLFGSPMPLKTCLS